MSRLRHKAAIRNIINQLVHEIYNDDNFQEKLKISDGQTNIDTQIVNIHKFYSIYCKNSLNIGYFKSTYYHIQTKF